MKNAAVCVDFFVENSIFRPNRASKRNNKFLLSRWVLLNEFENGFILMKKNHIYELVIKNSKPKQFLIFSIRRTIRLETWNLYELTNEKKQWTLLSQKLLKSHVWSYLAWLSLKSNKNKAKPSPANCWHATLPMVSSKTLKLIKTLCFLTKTIEKAKENDFF